jgi:hypothetical protein
MNSLAVIMLMCFGLILMISLAADADFNSKSVLLKVQEYLKESIEHENNAVEMIEGILGHSIAVTQGQCISEILEQLQNPNEMSNPCGLSSLEMGQLEESMNLAFGDMEAVPFAQMKPSSSGPEVVRGGLISIGNSCASAKQGYVIHPNNCYEMRTVIGDAAVEFAKFPINLTSTSNYLSFGLSCNNTKKGLLTLYKGTCLQRHAVAQLPVASLNVIPQTASTCFQTGKKDINGVKFAVQTNFKFSCSSYDCHPDADSQPATCNQRKKACQKVHIGLKWAGTGCIKNNKPVGDGGCQCNDYCGYTCQSACNTDSQCYWEISKGLCYNKLTNNVTDSATLCQPPHPLDPTTSTVPFEDTQACFPGDMNVVTRSGERVLMKDLRVGEEVMVANPATGMWEFSSVIGFLHIEREKPLEYLKLDLEDSTHITLSEEHILFALEAGSSIPTNVIAARIIPGRFKIWKLSAKSKQMHLVSVTRVTRIVKLGMYSPLTNHGTIVVNDVLASCYSTYQHDLVHAALSPYRWFRWLFPVTKKAQANSLVEPDGILPFATALRALNSFFPSQMFVLH